MLERYYDELKQNTNIRENLSLIRKEVKSKEGKESILALLGEGEILCDLLKSEEPKVRKNAALLLGDLQMQQAVSSLFDAYENETTLFVKSAYLTALGRMDASEYLQAFKERKEALLGKEIPENEKKHTLEELRELEKLITGIEGITRHTFCGLCESCDILLATNREQRAVTANEAAELSAAVRRSVSMHPLGVLVHTKDLIPFTKLRTYRELLFPIKMKQKLGNKPADVAAAVFDSDMPEILFGSHKEDLPFYFRLEIKSRMELDKKSSFAKQFAAELERISARRFVNSTSDYEVEIRLVETKDGRFAAFYKLFTVPMKRFSYRKNSIAASIHPATAAMLVQLAKPYLKENAQILDPFCGVGTMIIERDICVPARDKYGIDIFGDAVQMARENATAAGELVNFINRDYFDFKHDYLFDEIITNMPTRGKKTREEMDTFYARFFQKSVELLKRGAVVVMYSNEEGFVKKHLRLRTDYRLLQEYCIREKEHFYLFVIQYKG